MDKTIIPNSIKSFRHFQKHTSDIYGGYNQKMNRCNLQLKVAVFTGV